MTAIDHSPHPYQIEETAALEDETYLRIVRADLAQRVNKALTADTSLKKYVIYQSGQLYFSLVAFDDPQQRQHIRRQLQRIQLGEQNVIAQLPLPLQQLLKPEWTPVGRFVAAATVGLAVGITCGTLAMATSLLLTAVTELIIGHNMETDIVGMQVTAVAFVIFSVLGAAVTVTHIWHKIPTSYLILFQRADAGASSQTPQSPPPPPPLANNGTGDHTE